MPSLKELKTRIQSVNSTQKITSAMKMVSSVKLMKAEKAVSSYMPYEQALSKIMKNYLSSQPDEIASPFMEVRPVHHEAIVVFASNTSLCGTYNSNIVKMFDNYVEGAIQKKESLLVFAIGKKVLDASRKANLNVAGNFEEIANLPTFNNVKPIADELMSMFLNKEIDRVQLIYSHYINKGSQKLVSEPLLPFKIAEEQLPTTKFLNDYIIEPSSEEIEELLIPLAIRAKLYSAALQAHASEHAARTIAMQIATDNADNLLHDLSLQYNKVRQESITNQILDIIGGSL